jgi:hypothetical protein
MAKTTARPEPTITRDRHSLRLNCPTCGHRMWADYTNRRTIATLPGLTRLNLAIRRCHHPGCTAERRPYRPEAEGRYARPRHALGLDVVALVGALRYAEPRSVPEIHRHLVGRGLAVAERTVTNPLDRYDELLAVVLTDDRRRRALLADQGRVILALDGLQPDVGHEVLWGIRDGLSGEVLRAKSLLSARRRDLADLPRQVRDGLAVPIAGVVSDGQQSIRTAVALALPGVPHQLGHFHYLREAARPIDEADRHAKKALKKRVRQVRGIERPVEGRTEAEAAVITGYCSAVRSARTDDGRPPLGAAGIQLQDRLSAIADSRERGNAKGGSRPRSSGARGGSTAGWKRPPTSGRRPGWRTGGCRTRPASSGRRRPAGRRAGGWADASG